METESSATETVESPKVAIVSAHYHAQGLSDSLHLAYWFDGRDNYSAEYHRKAAVDSYNTLTQIMRDAGMIP